LAAPLHAVAARIEKAFEEFADPAEAGGACITDAVCALAAARGVFICVSDEDVIFRSRIVAEENGCVYVLIGQAAVSGLQIGDRIVGREGVGRYFRGFATTVAA
jgi:hypothetical protein